MEKNVPPLSSESLSRECHFLPNLSESEWKTIRMLFIGRDDVTKIIFFDSNAE